ncbi:calcium-binding protein [Aquitalea magnusonii]|uniref:calcium-binding protein n=1 Tax=Aquitalea magnusonii TaxID=332411 RepID=UPI0011AE2FDA|nr:calcium-binding protein [Aquitalea magnusonii]
MATVKLSKEDIKTNKDNLEKSTVVVPVCHDCGCDYGEIIGIGKYGATYGPIYNGSIPVDHFTGWPEMIKNGSVTAMEKKIIIIMSANEGNMDAVQSYDDQALTAGAMQKTVNPTGGGEFAAQVSEFKDEQPDLYKALFENCGWTVEGKGVNGAKMYYQDKDLTENKKLTGNALKSFLRNPSKFNKVNRQKKKMQEFQPLASMIKAIKHEKFLEKQIRDFIKRLRFVMNLEIQDGKNKYKVSEIFKSELGIATALDQHVNKPAHVTSDIKAAIYAYIEKHPTIKPDPSSWGSSHAKIEAEILEIYGVSRRGTDMASRFDKLKAR